MTNHSRPWDHILQLIPVFLYSSDECLKVHVLQSWIIGASLSKPHTTGFFQNPCNPTLKCVKRIAQTVPYMEHR